MPPSSLKLNDNSIVSVSKRFISNKEAKQVLMTKFDWNTPGLEFKGRTIAIKTVENQEMYDDILDTIPGIKLTLKPGCLKYVGPVVEEGLSSAASTSETQEETIKLDEDDDEEDLDLTADETGWTKGGVFIDPRLNVSTAGYSSEASILNMPGYRDASPLDYFLFFLPVHHLNLIIINTNIHARCVLGGSWTDITLTEYLKWLALLTVTTVIRHADRKAYWKQGRSHLMMNFDFSDYMSLNRFNNIMKMHVFQVPTKEKQQYDPVVVCSYPD